jgi:molecular chaperone GrpE
MDSNNKIKESFSEEMDLKSSIEDFLRELEEKEKDLNISEEMVIEIDEDSPEQELPEFIKTEITVVGDAASQNPNIQISSEPVQPAQISGQTNQIADLENQIGELKKALLRRQMDFDNYRKRIERERGDTFQNQISNLATQMLPVLDNLNRALDAASHFQGEQSADFRQFFDGIALVNQQLNEVLNEMGVQPVVTVGEAFNPHFHDAVATEATNDFPPNTITEELLRGYRLGDKLIRAAMVKVASPAE